MNHKPLIIYFVILVTLCTGFIVGAKAKGEQGVYLAQGYMLTPALALALLPTSQLAFANPLMPSEVSLYHFWEVSISTGIFGALCAWFLPEVEK